MKRSQSLKNKINTKNWLFVLPTDSVQGSEQIVMNLAKYLVKNGNKAQVIILTKKNKKGWIHLENEMKIIYFPFANYIWGILYFIPYLFFFHKQKTDYTFTSQTLINGTLGFSKKIGFFKNTKIIVRESNSIFDLFKGPKLMLYSLFYRIGYSKSSLVICQTEYMKTQLVTALPKLFEGIKVQVIPNPIDFLEIETKAKVTIKALKNKKYLVAAGRLVPAKGFDILIEAFNKVSLKIPDLELIILGAGKDQKKLEEIRDSLGLEDKITFPGYVPNVYPYFKEAEACILSSRIEGFPNVLLQMMSQNTKAVATLSAGGIEDIPGIFKCAPNNIEELSHAIIDCLQNNTEKNRSIFDGYLQGRTQDSFYKAIISNI
ncbi:glycosyltransferase [Sediminicola arcticus]|uniref:Glycosyltransferase n=1 Tax=Sediminicola arcticus TaxID=1574308 RepID=A0ABV2SW81_9FLAO